MARYVRNEYMGYGQADTGMEAPQMSVAGPAPTSAIATSKAEAMGLDKKSWIPWLVAASVAGLLIWRSQR